MEGKHTYAGGPTGSDDMRAVVVRVTYLVASVNASGGKVQGRKMVLLREQFGDRKFFMSSWDAWGRVPLDSNQNTGLDPVTLSFLW